jgi:hypothetical protein
MSVTYVHALVDVPRPAVPGRRSRQRSLRVEGRRIDLIAVGPVVAAVEELERPPKLSERSLRAQHRIIVALARRFDAILPARFGTVVDEAELARLMAGRGKRIQRSFEAVRGRAQMTVRFFGSEPGSAPVSARARPRTGTDYLEERMDAARVRLPESAAAVRRAVGLLVERERVEPGRDLVRAAVHHLIRRDRAKEYEALVRRALGRRPATDAVVVSGPWPPFAFTPSLLP